MNFYIDLDILFEPRQTKEADQQVVNTDNYSLWNNDRSEHTLQNMIWMENKVSGEVNVKDEQYLFRSLP